MFYLTVTHFSGLDLNVQIRSPPVLPSCVLLHCCSYTNFNFIFICDSLISVCFLHLTVKLHEGKDWVSFVGCCVPRAEHGARQIVYNTC